LGETFAPTGTDFREKKIHLFFRALKKALVKTPLVRKLWIFIILTKKR
jgi:hypothetical protein